MRKLFLLILLATPVVVALVASAGAQTPCTLPEAVCNADPSQLSVAVEPPGENCANGGIAITVTPLPDPTPTPTDTATPEPTETPTPDPTETPTPEPTVTAAQAPEPETFYVCNGDTGQDGMDGQDGQDGQNGLDGSDGFDGQDGQGTSNTGSARHPACGKASRTVSQHLPVRFRSAKRVVVVLDGHRHGLVVRRRTVRIDLRGLACGSYPAVVQRRGIKPFVRIFTLHRNGRVSRISVGN